MGGGALPSISWARRGSCLCLGCHKSTACSYQPLLSCSQGRKWWMNTDEPWQALACCMEIAKASRSPDPAAYISHFPVHQVGAQQICMVRAAEQGEEGGQGRKFRAEASRSATLHLLRHAPKLS